MWQWFLVGVLKLAWAWAWARLLCSAQNKLTWKWTCVVSSWENEQALRSKMHVFFGNRLIVRVSWSVLVAELGSGFVVVEIKLAWAWYTCMNTKSRTRTCIHQGHGKFIQISKKNKRPHGLPFDIWLAFTTFRAPLHAYMHEHAHITPWEIWGHSIALHDTCVLRYIPSVTENLNLHLIYGWLSTHWSRVRGTHTQVFHTSTNMYTCTHAHMQTCTHHSWATAKHCSLWFSLSHTHTFPRSSTHIPLG
jgi:hypothetical protein